MDDILRYEGEHDMKTIIAAILAIILTLFAMTGAGARAAERAGSDIDAATVTELSQVPDGYDAGGCPATYVVAIAE